MCAPEVKAAKGLKRRLTTPPESPNTGPATVVWSATEFAASDP